jgi:hypothetical protein
MGTAIIVVLDLSTPDYKEAKIEHDMSLRLMLERSEHMSTHDFARTAVGMAHSRRERDGLIVAHIAEPSVELLRMLHKMDEDYESHYACPVGRSELLPLIGPHIISVGFWRSPSGECLHGWRPAALGATDVASHEEMIKRNWEGA